MNSTLPQSVTYIARDIERALGVQKNTVNYAIISNNSTFAKESVHSYDVTLVESDETLSTQELLAGSNIEKNTHILVFKNTKAIERLATEKEVHLLNPSAELAGKIEEKISQIAWLGELTKFLPPHDIKTCKELMFDMSPYIVQFNHAHSGIGTMLITSEGDLVEVKEKFPNRPVRMTQFIDGPVYTVNAVVHTGGVLVSSPSYQITGLSPFTDNQFTTIGNDWGAAHTMLSDAQKETIHTMATEIGEQMKNDDWKGLFGIDVVVEEKTGTVYLIEINARQPASTTFESWLQDSSVATYTSELSTFVAHLRALLGENLSEYSLIPVEHGVQILQRMTTTIADVQPDSITVLRDLDCTVIPYDQRTLGAELLRIQSDESFIQSHTLFTALGKKIAHELEKSNKNI